MMKKWIFTTLLATLALSASAWTTNDIQPLLDELPDGAVHQHEMLEMRDGTSLSTHYFLPAGYASNAYPVVLLRSAYNHFPDWNRYIDDIVDQSDTNNYVYKNTNGYVYVIQNLRGDGDSETSTGFEPRLSDNEINDAYDTIETIATNAWCNGRVGMYGGSGHGMAAYMGWLSKAPHLTVCSPGNTAPNLYEHWSFENGVRRWIYDWLSNRGADTSEWPKPTLGDYYTRAQWEQTLAAGATSNRATLFATDSWHNFFLDSTFEMLNAVGSDTHGYLTMDSGTHQGDLDMYSPATLGVTNVIGFPNPSGLGLSSYDIPSFLEILDGATATNDFYLQYYVMGDARRDNAEGNFWRETESWPPPAIRTPYYMHADGTLSETAPFSTTDALSYSYHPTNPVPTVGGNYSYGFDDLSGPLDQNVPELTNRNDILRFETAPFAEATEITGDLEAQLYVSTDVEDTTFMVKLIDIYPAEGTNTKYHAIMRESAIMGRYWGGLTNPAPMVSGTVYRLDIDMSAISLLVETNHRIAVHVTSSSDKAFEVHPNTYEQVNSYDSSPTAHNTLYLNSDYPSKLILPHYTTNAPTVEVSTNSVVAPEGGSVPFDVWMNGPALYDVTLSVARASGDTNITVSGGTSLIFTTGTWSDPQTVTLAASEDADALNGSATIEITGTGVVPASLTATESDNDVGIILSASSLNVPEGGSNTFTLALNRAPASAVTVTVSRASGDTNLNINGSSSFVFSSNDWNSAQTVTISADEDADESADSAVFSCSSPDAIDTQLTATEVENDYSIVASGLLAAWDLESITSSTAPVLTTNAYFMATGLVNNSSAGVLEHSNPYEQKGTTYSVAAIDNDEATLNAAIAAGNYFKWGLQTEPGYRLTITSVVFRTESDSPMVSALLSDLSGTNSLATNPSGLQVGTADLSGNANFETINGTVEFRVYGYATANQYGRLVIGNAWNTDGGSDDIKIYGTVTAVGGDVTVQAQTNMVSVPEDGSTQYGIRLSGEPSGTVTVLTSKVSGDTDLSVSEGASLVFNTTTWSNWQNVTLSATEDADYTESSALFRSLLDGTAFNVEVTATEQENDRSVEFSSASLSVAEGGSSNVQIRLTSAPQSDVTVNITLDAGDSDLNVSNGSPAIFSSANWSNWQTVTFSAVQDDDADSSPALFKVSGTGLTPTWLQVFEADDETPPDTSGVLGPPRQDWRLTALDVTASTNYTALKTALTNDTDGAIDANDDVWIAVQVPAIADPAMLTFQADQLISASAQYSYDSTDGQDGTWTDTPVEIYQPNTGAHRLQKLDIPVGGSRWMRLAVTNNAGGAFTVSSVGMYQLDPDGWNDYWVLGGASIQEWSVRNLTFKGLVQTNYGYDPVLFNTAVAGSTAGGVLARMDDDLGRHPYARYIAVAGGGNNITANRPWPGGATTLSNDLRGVLQMIVASNKVPIMCRLSFRAYTSDPVVNTASDPSSETNGSLPYVEHIYDPLIAEFCPDFYDWTEGQGDIDAYTYFFENQDELSPDGVHPTTEGEYAWNVLWADGASPVYGSNTTIAIDVESNTVTVAEGSSATLKVRLSAAPATSSTVTVSRISGDADITISSGVSLVFTTNDWNIYKTVTLAAAEDDDTNDDSATIQLTGIGLVPTTATAIESDNDTPAGGQEIFRILVDAGTAYATSGNWNTYDSIYTTGLVLTDMIDTNGNATSIDLRSSTGFSGANNTGVDNGSIYPSTAQRDSLYLTGTGSAGTQKLQNILTLEGLDTNYFYTITLFGSRISSVDDRTTRFIVNGSTGYVHCADNTTNTAVFSEVPTSDGTIAIEMGPYNESGTMQQYAYLGVMDIVALTPTTNGDPDDSDNDGLPNDWEQQYFGGITNANPTNITANGVNTIEEAYIAGLNPTNPSSFFRLSGLEGNVLQWSAVSGRIYKVYWTSNLLSGFQLIESNFTGGSFTDEVHGSERKGFYQIEVEVAP